MTLLRSILLVAMGGALGSVGRFLLSKAVQEHAATAFPVATFAVNVVGCFVIGLVYGLSLRGVSGGLKRSLVCNKKKPCLQSKEALFATQRSLVWRPQRNALILK